MAMRQRWFTLIAIEYSLQGFPVDGCKIRRLVFVVHRHMQAEVGITRMEIVPAEIPRMASQSRPLECDAATCHDDRTDNSRQSADG